MPNDRTATAWLTSPRVTSLLAQFRAEDRALAELHSAHVEAWMTADCCAYCGDFAPDLRRGKCETCRANEPVEREDHGESFGETYAARCRGPL